MTESPGKRAPATGVRVVRGSRKPGVAELSSPVKLSSSLGGEDKKRRPFTTPARGGEGTKRDPSTPTRTVRPYRPNTGGIRASHGLVVVDSGDLGSDPIEWINEEAGPVLDLEVLSCPEEPLQPQITSPPTIPLGKDGSRVRTGSKTLIGKGSYGCVYRGLHEGTNQIVAIKEIHLTGESASKVNMIRKEIQLMKRLNHPNIVRYLGAERVKAQLHIYLEFVTGGSMAALVKEYGPLTEPMARKYSSQVLDGLAYLHSNSIVHRDIKGDNLLVGTDGTVKLADFGTSRELRTLAATVTGTACFMAPEVIKGTGHGLESDVWSLGCAVIEMLNGTPPFSTFGNQYATMMHVAGLQGTEHVIPTGVAAEARFFLLSCLQVDPRRRKTATELLLLDWFSGAKHRGQGANNLTKGSAIDCENMEFEAAPAGPVVDNGDDDTESTIRYNPMLSYVEDD